MAERVELTFQVEDSGKTVKTLTTSGGKLIFSPTTTTTTTSTGVTTADLTVAGDTGTVKFDIAQTNLSVVGGRSVKTSITEGKLEVELKDSIAFRQAIVSSYSALSPLIIKDINDQVVFSIGASGIPTLTSKDTLPGVTSGLIYISGSLVTQEGYYLGFPEVDNSANENGEGSVTG